MSDDSPPVAEDVVEMIQAEAAAPVLDLAVLAAQLETVVSAIERQQAANGPILPGTTGKIWDVIRALRS